MNKRGQFFLIAALVIVGIIFGLATIYNTAQSSKEDTAIYDLSDEINFEAAQVIDNGVFHLATLDTVSVHIENLTDFYSAENTDSDLIIIYGDESKLIVVFYNQTNTGSVGINIGGDISLIPQTDISKLKAIKDSPTSDILVELGFGIPYEFTLRPGQVFYLVIKKENSEERYIVGPGQPTVSSEIPPTCDPTAAEICTDGKDNNCNSLVDCADTSACAGSPCSNDGVCNGGLCFNKASEVDQSCNSYCESIGKQCNTNNWNDDNQCTVCKYFHPGTTPTCAGNIAYYAPYETKTTYPPNIYCIYRVSSAQICSTSIAGGTRFCVCEPKP